MSCTLRIDLRCASLRRISMYKSLGHAVLQPDHVCTVFHLGMDGYEVQCRFSRAPQLGNASLPENYLPLITETT